MPIRTTAAAETASQVTLRMDKMTLDSEGQATDVVVDPRGGAFYEEAASAAAALGVAVDLYIVATEVGTRLALDLCSMRVNQRVPGGIAPYDHLSCGYCRLLVLIVWNHLQAVAGGMCAGTCLWTMQHCHKMCTAVWLASKHETADFV